MEYIALNFLPILAATAVAVAFGAAWYALLSGPWRLAAGISERQAKAQPRRWLSYAVAAAAEFWIAAIMAGALILAPPQAGAWTMAIGTALILWSSFVVPTTIVNYRFQLLPWRLVLIDCGHWLGVFLLQVAVLQAWGLKAPPGA